MASCRIATKSGGVEDRSEQPALVGGDENQRWVAELLNTAICDKFAIFSVDQFPSRVKNGLLIAVLE